MHRQHLVWFISLWIFLWLVLPTGGLADEKPAPQDWLTKAERTEFRETARYDETMDYCRRLEKASPWIRVTSFGKSGEGRDLPLVIASKDLAFDPVVAAKTGKAVVLIQNGIHAGEIDGKDASLMLLREIAISKPTTAGSLLDHVILLVIPIYNVDGHERFGPYNRINQNGPAEQGWRVTAANLNLNRDYMKADAPETRAWLRLFTAWRPDLFIDTHVTDGADFQYDVTYLVENNINVAPSVARWATEHIVERVLPALDRAGHLSSPYIFLRDDTDPGKGLQGGVGGPRFSTSYAALQNRVAFLIETHMLKDYRTRVMATYDLLRLLLEEVNRDPESLRRAVRQADEETVAAGRPSATDRSAGRLQIPLRFRSGQKATPVLLKGFQYRRELSEISGGIRIIYEKTPMEMTMPRYEDIQVAKAVTQPLGYLIPPSWGNVIEVLAAHGLRLERLTEPVTAEFESYRFQDVKWQERPFEGRHPVTFEAKPIRETRTYPAGSVLVRLDQPAAKIAIYLLEPDSGEGFVSWGFFDTIFEQKEYAEDYVLEKLAREMLAPPSAGLAPDPKLKKEFEERIRSDKEFAGDPRQRLAFFYERSPWWDSRINVYPVARVMVSLAAATQPQ
jgi:hypothetical protein